MQRLPQTDSIRELALFWDTHDVTDFEDELEEVTETVFQRDTAILLHLPPSAAEVLHDMAETKGVADAELIREWVLERVHSE